MLTDLDAYNHTFSSSTQQHMDAEVSPVELGISRVIVTRANVLILLPVYIISYIKSQWDLISIVQAASIALVP